MNEQDVWYETNFVDTPHGRAPLYLEANAESRGYEQSHVAAQLNRGNQVYNQWVQRALNHVMGLRLAVDGNLGPLTRGAIRTFQQRRGLTVDGIVGTQTERALIQAGAPAPPRPASRPRPAAHGLVPPVTGSALQRVRTLASPSVRPDVITALALIKAIAEYHHLPWRIPYVILQHEGGVRLVSHTDGVMQTTSVVRQGTIPRIPRALKLALLGLPATDGTSETALSARLRQEFRRRLAIQIATGVQELKDKLERFNGYVALAFQAYNAGSGWAYYTVTRGRQKQRPRGTTTDQWEEMCRFGAALLHQPARSVNVAAGVWQCDKNIPAWFRHIPVRDQQSGLSLVAFKYLRSVRECIRANRPALPCNASNHKRREPGSGPVRCRDSRAGALDKLYDPTQLGRTYYSPVRQQLQRIADDGMPLKVQQGQLVKVPAASGAVTPIPA